MSWRGRDTTIVAVDGSFPTSELGCCGTVQGSVFDCPFSVGCRRAIRRSGILALAVGGDVGTTGRDVDCGIAIFTAAFRCGGTVIPLMEKEDAGRAAEEEELADTVSDDIVGSVCAFVVVLTSTLMAEEGLVLSL